MGLHEFKDSELMKHEVRLFPTKGIKGETEAENRATEALLSMVRAVAEFGGAIIKNSGGPGGKAKNVQCYTELGFVPDFADDKESARPDGIIERMYGKKEWIALIEVKVGSNHIEEKQLNKYLNWAYSRGFNALITVSNQTNRPGGEPPYSYNRKIKSVKVKHFSWEGIHSIVRLLCGKEEKIEDVDQKWMLEQFDRYLADENSGIIASPSLGTSWHLVLKYVKDNTLSVHSNLARDVIEHWWGFLRIASLRLTAEIGEEVRLRMILRSKKDYEGLIKEECKKVINEGKLLGELVFPRMNDIRLCLNLINKELQLTHKIDAPDEGRRDTRIKWIIHELKNLKNVPKNLRVKVDWKKRRLISSGSFGELEESFVPLLRGKDNEQIKKDVMPKCFYLEYETKIRGSRGKGSIEELKVVLKNLRDFYDLVSRINRPIKKPAQLPKSEEELPDETKEKIA